MPTPGRTYIRGAWHSSQGGGGRTYAAGKPARGVRDTTSLGTYVGFGGWLATAWFIPGGVECLALCGCFSGLKRPFFAFLGLEKFTSPISKLH